MNETKANAMIVRLLSVGFPEKGLTKTVKEGEIIALCCKFSIYFRFAILNEKFSINEK